MKTIATASIFVILTASAWADEPENKQTDEPILLSEAEMDEVTAGASRKGIGEVWINTQFEKTASKTSSAWTSTDIKEIVY